MADPPGVLRRGAEDEAGELAGAEDIPEAELRPQLSIALDADTAGGERLRIQRTPVGEVRTDQHILRRFQIGGRIDQAKDAGAG